LGPLTLPNRYFLAPLAGVSDWPFRLLCREQGASIAHTEMISSHGLVHGGDQTLSYLERPESERPFAIQVVGHDPEILAQGARVAVERYGPVDAVDINMGCPVRKVRRTGAGVELLREPELALALARAAAAGSGLPVTVKLRSGIAAGERSGFELAVRLAEEAGVAAIAFHPRAATAGHKGSPDYALARELAAAVEVPTIVSGGLNSAAAARRAYEEAGAAAVMIARGSLGNPWLFEELTGRRAAPPGREEVAAELLWTIDRAEEHLGAERAGRYLRKFYPWYLERLDAPAEVAAELQGSDLKAARALVRGLAEPVLAHS
jgi:tRNA-dihydrouridine synthase B